MEAKEYPRFDAKFVREHYQHKQEEYWKREGIKEVTDDMKLAVTTGTADIVDLIIKYEAKLKEWHIETD